MNRVPPTRLSKRLPFPERWWHAVRDDPTLDPITKFTASVIARHMDAKGRISARKMARAKTEAAKALEGLSEAEVASLVEER